jgi:ribosomal 30S subunit maturation factor RimM
MPAFSKNGNVINLFDNVSCQGMISSITGSGALALVTVLPLLTTSTVVVQANDCRAVQHAEPLPGQTDAASTYPATGIAGMYFGVAGEQVTILGTVTAITGTGNTALLTVTCASSGRSIVVPSGSCASASDNAGVQ